MQHFFRRRKNVKKMCPARKNYTPQAEVLGFTYPKLHVGKNWYVDFYAFDPATDSMRRKKYMLDRIGKVTQRRRRATEIIESLLKLLRSGWSPWSAVASGRPFRPHCIFPKRLRIESIYARVSVHICSSQSSLRLWR